jgi:hypothetical protein
MRPGGRVHFEDPYKSQHDFSHAIAFLVAIALLVGIGVLVFRGTAWLVAGDLQTADIPVIARSVASVRTPVATTATAVPAATLGAVTAAPTSPPIAIIQPPTPVPAATPSATGTQRYRIGNTGGDGAYLRRSPRLADRLNAWPDNTILVDLGEEATGDGLTWRKVQAPNGSTGYMPTRWLVPVPGQ